MTSTVTEQTTLRFGTGNLIYRDRFCYSHYPAANYPPRAVCLTIDHTCGAVVSQKTADNIRFVVTLLGSPMPAKKPTNIILHAVPNLVRAMLECRRRYYS